MKKPSLRETKYRVLPFTFSRLAAIMAEFDQSEAVLRDALFIGHGISVPVDARAMTLYFVVTSDQMEDLADHRVPSPTVMQLLGTCRHIGISEDDAVQRFKAAVKAEN